jgi:2-keto-3-deoxy-galactonokinase
MAKPKTLFVYYKVPSEQREHFKGLALSEMQARMHDHASLSAQLLQRPEVSKEGFETWMEIYEREGSGIESDLQEALQRSFSASKLPFKRMVEVFIPLQ